MAAELRIMDKDVQTDEIMKGIKSQDVCLIKEYRSCDTVDVWSFRKPRDVESENSGNIRLNVDLHAESYNMNHKRRGTALIFNHVNFKNMPTRRGTVKDGADFENALNNLDFDVRIYTDPTVKTILAVLQSTAAEDHTDADCLIVAVMSHGESGLLFSYDNPYPVDMLWNPFIGKACSSLVGKPKLFFIQACRGSQLDGGVRITDETDGKASCYSIPSHADIMVAYSTYEGFYSWRNPDSGSWFIQSICQEFNRQGRTHDLLTLMTFVNRRVAVEYESFVPHDKNFHEKKQIPCVVTMLTRLVYFPEKRILVTDKADAPKEADKGKSERQGTSLTT